MVVDSGYRWGYGQFASENGFDSAKQKATPQRAIRAIYASVLVERAPHLHAGLCGAEVSEIEVAQVLVVSQPPSWPWLLVDWLRKNGGTPEYISFCPSNNCFAGSNPQQTSPGPRECVRGSVGALR